MVTDWLEQQAQQHSRKVAEIWVQFSFDVHETGRSWEEARNGSNTDRPFAGWELRLREAL